MKASKLMLATLKEAPQEAQISSHILLIRAGMIRKLVAGVYNYLPLGLRVLRKIENIIREEMDESGALEILSSAIQPKELWEASGRWNKYGPELIRFKDRHSREFCLGPTHEEIFTDLVKNEIKSYKSLPMNLYQIQTKYRDEVRPRFGLMRGREFIMKDSYSFDVDDTGLDASYKTMYDTYSRIFDRLHINYQVVLADTGAIGGSESHQFMALSDIGESNIIYCECGYAADEEKANTLDDTYKNDEEIKELEEVYTPNVKTIEEVANFLNVSTKDIAKAVVYSVNEAVKTIDNKDEIVAMSLSTQGGTILPVDENFKPLCLAYTWMDERAVDETAALKAKYGEEIYERSGWRCSACFDPARMLWMKANDPDSFNNAHSFVSTVEYIVSPLPYT